MSCASCERELPPDGKTRKRQRARRCHECITAAAIQRKHDDPILVLQHRLNGNLKKYWKDADPILWSRQTVKYVYERWDKKSVLSGETDPIHLCIVPIIRLDEQPTREDLVLITSKEAQSLSRVSNDLRMAAFPASVQEQMQKKN